MLSDEMYRGTDVSYVCICLRRAWLSTHEIYITDGTEFVKMGSYTNDVERNYGYSQVSIGRNKIDYLQLLPDKKCIIHEFKRGRKVIDADLFQISHYMNIASSSGYDIDHGEIHFLGSKKIKKVNFPLENENSLKEKYRMIDKLKQSTIPKMERNYFCSHGCSYVEFCWGSNE